MDEMVDSVAAYVESELAGQLPRDLTILSVCAKGDTSQFVGQGLRRLGYLERQPEWWDESLGRARPSLCHGGVLPPAPLRCDPSDGCRPRDHSIRADPGWPGLPRWTAQSRGAAGHTLGLVAFRLEGRYLFAGDSIFIRSIARPDLGGKADLWAPLHGRSLRRLLELPGHFSSLDEQNEDGFVRYLLDSLPRFVPEYVDIKRVNTGLLKPVEEDAWALELGKNACGLSQANQPVAGALR